MIEFEGHSQRKYLACASPPYPKTAKFVHLQPKDTKIEISNQNTTLFVAQAIPECKYRYKKWSLWSEELLRLTMNSTMKLYYLHHIEESSRCISLHLRKLPDHADPWIRVKYRPSTLHELNSNRKSNGSRRNRWVYKQIKSFMYWCRWTCSHKP